MNKILSWLPNLAKETMAWASITIINQGLSSTLSHFLFLKIVMKRRIGIRRKEQLSYVRQMLGKRRSRGRQRARQIQRERKTEKYRKAGGHRDQRNALKGQSSEPDFLSFYTQ